MSDFKFAGFSVEMQPSITKWGFEDLGDDPTKHRWRAWWADDGTGGVCGIQLRAYPVIKVNPASVWINEDGCREATKQPWEDGAPAMEWVLFNPARMKKRICHNGASAAWAKPTQDEAIRSLAIRLCRWTNHIARKAERATSAVRALEQLRSDLPGYTQTARANLASIKGRK
jgi:hypothetical protein